MKYLVFIGLAAASSLSFASTEIKISDIQSIELRDRQILTIEDVKKFEYKIPTGKLDLRKIPNLNNIELKNGHNISADQLNNVYVGRMMEGGQDGGGG